MIFATVGTQLPFDRMIGALDAWAGSQDPPCEVFAQIGPGELVPRHLEWARFIEPEECDRRMDACIGVVAHAGMGSIIGAIQRGKPIVIVPRRADLGEHRNDHQLATASRFGARSGVRVVLDEEELGEAVDALLRGELVAGDPIGTAASEELLRTVRSFIEGSG